MKRIGVLAVLVSLGLVVRAKTSLPLPQALRVPPTEEHPEGAAARGRLVYGRYGCALCHGAEAKGGFANLNAETAGKVPGLLYVAEGYTAAELRRKLLDGLPNVGRADPRGPRPPYRMPGWAGQMTEEEAKDLVQYLMGLYPKSAEEKWR